MINRFSKLITYFLSSKFQNQNKMKVIDLTKCMHRYLCEIRLKKILVSGKKTAATKTKFMNIYAGVFNDHVI